ncbi:MAG TPA: PAS domain S-box protein, partial [Puia sp.]
MHEGLGINEISNVRTRHAGQPPDDLFHLLPVAVYTCDREGRITYFNETAVKLWGYRPDVGNPLVRFCACYKVFVNGAYIPPEQTPMAITLETGRSFRNVQAIVQRPDGSSFHAMVTIDPVYDDKNMVTGAINVFSDISEIKKTEEDLKESEIRIRQLIYSLNTPLYATDMEGRITIFNPAAATLWGREPVVGKDLWNGSLKIMKPDGTELAPDKCPMAVCLKERRPVNDETIMVVRPDGSIRHVAPHPQPLYDGNGDMIGAINMLLDITEVKDK